jgi:hypothetical protein
VSARLFSIAIADIVVDIPAVKTKCGYACSDHASFGKAGFQSAFAYVSSLSSILASADEQYREHLRGLEPQHSHFSGHYEPPRVLLRPHEAVSDVIYAVGDR